MTARTIAGLLVVASLATPFSGPRFDKRISKDKEAVHALQRLTFGPRPGDVAVVEKLGVKKWVEQQLNPQKIAENPVLEARLTPLSSLTMSQQELAKAYPPQQLIRAFASGKLPLPQDPQRRAAIERLIQRSGERSDQKKNGEGPSPGSPRMLPPQQALARELFEQKLYRAVYGNRQLEEVLTDFWFNHFNVFLDKGADRFLVTAYERDAIRPHVLGKFKDLLRATAESPAMLFYLDNWQSVAPDLARPRARRARGLNENYARELLELHTLGVDGGYTQKDVMEVARCFTGWSIAQPYQGAEFIFNPRVHDNGEKKVLGVRIPAGGGKEDGLKVLEILADHPSTARFISTRLAQRFVADNPPESLIKNMSDTFRKSHGDIRAVLRAMFRSREFWSEAAYKSKIKTPLEMVASSLRATGADMTSALRVAQRVAELGQPLYRKQEPTGYSNQSSEWVNSAALLGRMNFALDLTRNKVPGVKIDTRELEGDPHQVAKRLLFTDASPQTRAAIEKGLTENQSSATIAGLILGSPEFQRR